MRKLSWIDIKEVEFLSEGESVESLGYLRVKLSNSAQVDWWWIYITQSLEIKGETEWREGGVQQIQ